MKLQKDVLRELMEISAHEPKDVRCHDQNEAQHERALERLLILIVTAGCRIAMHRQPQNNGFRDEQPYLSPFLRYGLSGYYTFRCNDNGLRNRKFCEPA